VPVFQSALWHYYSYWFDAASRSVKNGLRAMIRPFALWHPPPNTEGTENDSAAEEISSFVDKATEVIDRLCSTRYAHPLRRAFGISEPTWTPSKSPLFAEFLRGRGIIPTEVPGPDPGTVFRMQGESLVGQNDVHIAGIRETKAESLEGVRLDFPKNGLPRVRLTLASVIRRFVRDEDVQQHMFQHSIQPYMIVTAQYQLEAALFEEIDDEGPAGESPLLIRVNSAPRKKSCAVEGTAL
jgi:hypothetical protein